jgi:hypothetical protein
VDVEAKMKKLLLLVLILSACGGTGDYDYIFNYNDTNFYVYTETDVGRDQAQVKDWTRRTFATWPECPNSLRDVEINFMATKIVSDYVLPDGRQPAGLAEIYIGWSKIKLGNWHYIKDLFFHELTHVILIYCGVESSEENVDSRTMNN